ncbi:MAG: amino acid adenylation domain-containing protein, partial [Acidobacteriota bacterium]
MHRLEPDSLAYNITRTFCLRGPLEIARLQAALTAIVRRHAVLRSVFVPGPDGRGQQRPRAPARRLALPRVDLRALAPSRRDAVAREIGVRFGLRPFRLDAAAPLRTALIDLGAQGDMRERRLLVGVHHIAFDGGSLRCWVDELAALYEGRAADLPMLPVQFADVAVWQRARADADALASRLAAIRARLVDAPSTLRLPADRPPREGAARRALRQIVPLAPDASAALRRLAIDLGATPFVVGLAAWALLLGRFGDAREVVVGTPVSGRTRREMEPLIGFFVNNLVLRIDLGDDGSTLDFRALVRRVRAVVLTAQADADVPFAALVEALDPTRRLTGETPIFPVMFAHEAARRMPATLGAAALDMRAARRGHARLDLDLTLQETGADGFALALIHDRSRFDTSTALRLLHSVRTLLTAAVTTPTRACATLPLIARTAERHALVHEWSGRFDDAPARSPVPSLHAVAASHAAHRPDDAAIVRGAQRVRYGALMTAAARLAALLRRIGVVPGARVVLALEPSVEALVAMLATWRAQAAWSALDPVRADGLTASDWRIDARAITDAAVVLVHHARTGQPAPDLPPGTRTIALDGLDLPAIDGLQAPGSIDAAAAGAAACRFASTSAMASAEAIGDVDHAALTRAAQRWQNGPFGAWIVPWIAPLTSAATVRQALAPLLGGRAMHLPDAASADGPVALWATWAAARRAAGDDVVLDAPASLWRRLRAAALSREIASRPLLDALLLDAAAPVDALVTATQAVWPRAAIVHLVGADETIGPFAYDRIAGASGPATRRVAGLRLLPGARVHVVDRRLAPQPIGAVGALTVDGLCLPEGIAAASGAPGRRLYRTAITARWRADGRVMLCEAAAQRLRVRGVRLKRDAIEWRLEGLAEIAGAAVQTVGKKSDVRLVVRIEPAASSTIAAALTASRAAIARAFPVAAAAIVTVAIDRLPRALDGSIDRARLPAPAVDVFDLQPSAEAARRVSNRADAGVPVSTVAPAHAASTQLLGGLWQTLLGLPQRPAARDDFFALGGHSLHATQLAARIEARTGVVVPLRTLFERADLSAMADWLAARWQPGDDALVAAVGSAEAIAPSGDARASADAADAVDVDDAPATLGAAAPMAARVAIVALGQRRAEDAPDADDRSLIDRFVAQCAATPTAIALRWTDGGGSPRALDYAALADRVDALAHALVARGVAPGDAVGLLFPRGPAMIVALLAVQRAGGAYVPLRPDDPPARRALVAGDVGLRHCIAPPNADLTRALGDRTGAQIAHVALAADGTRPASAPAVPPTARLPIVDDGFTAYVLYTSGSTGRPKGVRVAHRSVLRLVRDAAVSALGPGETYLQIVPLSFDVSAWEIFAPLLSGATLALLPPGPFGIADLRTAIAQHGVTRLWLTAGFFHRVVDELPTVLAPLRQVVAGGDAVSPAHVRRLRAAVPGLRITNGYGPTENGILTAVHHVRDDADVPVSGPLPIGRAVARTTTYALNADLEPVSFGAFGELWTGGAGVAQGYHARPGLTAERFRPDPFADAPGARIYGTGDRVRLRPDGVLIYHGRLDGQVKLRGQRLELGEITAALTDQTTRVADAAVVLHRRGAGDAQRDALEAMLVAYVVPASGAVAPDADGEAAWIAALRADLAARLPDYMVPSRVVRMASLPLSANGKLDRRALPAPDAPPRAEKPAASRPQPVGAEDPQPLPRDGRVALRASFAQERLWTLDRLADGRGTAYLMPFRVTLRGALDPAALTRSLGDLIDRHEALRTVFARADDGTIAQRIRPVDAHRPIALPTIDLTALADGEAQVARLLDAAARRPLDVARGPLLRVHRVRLAPARHALLVVVHHIVFDAGSIGVFLHDWATLYDGRVRGLMPHQLTDLPPLAVQPADVAMWRRTQLTPAVEAAALAHARAQLSGIEPLDLPTDRPRRAGATRSPARAYALRAGAETAHRLRQTAQRLRTTPHALLLAGLAVVLGRWSGQRRFAVGTPLTGRTQRALAPLVGFL